MKILVIDDEPLIHISIEKLIQACSKEDEVLHAYNGHEMLKMLEEHEIAMAYVDIKMWAFRTGSHKTGEGNISGYPLLYHDRLQ